MWKALIKKIFVWIWSISGKWINGREFHHASNISRKCCCPECDFKNGQIKGLELVQNFDHIPTERLVLIFGWLEAKRKHLDKYAQYYLNQNCDAHFVSLSWYNALWPETGAKVLAKYIAKFLVENDQYEKIIIHGFSGGAYIWGEVLEFMMEHQSLFSGKRIVGQIWDSLAVTDVPTMTIKFPKALLPNNPKLQNLLKQYLIFHTNTLGDHTTRHFDQSYRRIKETSMVNSPILMLGSKDDRIADVKKMEDLVHTWRLNGLKVYSHIWSSSPHVSHLNYHTKDYENELKKFLEVIQLLPYPSRFASKS